MPVSTVATIDFEGSALHGYPIEVGVALWHRERDEIRVWSTLIRPIAPWRKHPGRWWDPRSEEIHGIAASELDAGLHPREVMVRLNVIVSGMTAFCDGGPYDQAFLSRLSDAAGVAPSFELGNLKALSLHADLDYPGRLRFANLLAAGQDAIEHRAGSDALRLLRAVATAADRRPSVVVDVD